MFLTFLHSMEKKSTKFDFSPISCKKSTILHSKWTHLKSCCFFLISLRSIINLVHDLKIPLLDIWIIIFQAWPNSICITAWLIGYVKVMGSIILNQFFVFWTTLLRMIRHMEFSLQEILPFCLNLDMQKICNK